MKSGRAYIGIFQKMRIKNLREVSEVRFKKTRILHLGRRSLETSKNHLIRNFLHHGRLKILIKVYIKIFDSFIN